MIKLEYPAVPFPFDRSGELVLTEGGHHDLTAGVFRAIADRPAIRWDNSPSIQVAWPRKSFSTPLAARDGDPVISFSLQGKSIDFDGAIDTQNTYPWVPEWAFSAGKWVFLRGTNGNWFTYDDGDREESYFARLFDSDGLHFIRTTSQKRLIVDTLGAIGDTVSEREFPTAPALVSIYGGYTAAFFDEDPIPHILVMDLDLRDVGRAEVSGTRKFSSLAVSPSGRHVALSTPKSCFVHDVPLPHSPLVPRLEAASLACLEAADLLKRRQPAN